MPLHKEAETVACLRAIARRSNKPLARAKTGRRGFVFLSSLSLQFPFFQLAARGIGSWRSLGADDSISPWQCTSPHHVAAELFPLRPSEYRNRQVIRDQLQLGKQRSHRGSNPCNASLHLFHVDLCRPFNPKSVLPSWHEERCYRGASCD